MTDADFFERERPNGTLLPGTLASRRSVYPAFKRCIDVVGAVCLGLAALPFILICAWIITRDGGSAFFRQERVGRNGEVFHIWKLRTMCVDADRRLADHLAKDAQACDEWSVTQKLRLDPRVTPIGRWLRKYSVDELPQLLNVVVGEMSLIGPRPMCPDQKELYGGTAYYDLRPGMTGLWQVNDRNACSFAERAAYDTRYAEILSLRTDASIVIKTFGVVFRGTGC
ncbi:sugar transferase [Pelagibacterium sp. H642]|uniref:sugar transferase n=1 Tax=Pelagibacterium sp. H642 TaxID=1881069 RepID=UPI0028169DBE|nr:sugar transferase [Pelagibacterium sp. H642]WMT92839.1 sugar transferase [Pelagibacterium sp. H642]